jgi:hypothetical protein
VRKTVNEIEQLERTLDKESITFKELKEGILKYKAKSEYQQAAIIIIRGVLEKRLHENGGLHKHIVMPRFSSKEELREFIQLHFPIAIKPKKPAKTMFISPVTSANAQKVIIDCLVDAFLNGA